MTCDRCGKATRTIVPVMTAFPDGRMLSDDSRPLPRLALYALGVPEPAEHPDDNQFESWCEECVGLKRSG